MHGWHGKDLVHSVWICGGICMVDMYKYTCVNQHLNSLLFTHCKESYNCIEFLNTVYGDIITL